MCSTQILGSNKDVVSKVKEKTKRKKMHCNEFDVPELVIFFAFHGNGLIHNVRVDHSSLTAVKL